MNKTTELEEILAEVRPDLPYEQAYQRLEACVAALEAGEYPLETTLQLYQRGQELANHCAALLDQAELRVRQIAGDELVEFELDSE